jgi:hypothetical protein
LSSNHSYALASTSGVPDLTDRSQRVRIKYDPVFDISAVHHPSFITTEYTTQFLIVSFFEFLIFQEVFQYLYVYSQMFRMLTL